MSEEMSLELKRAQRLDDDAEWLERLADRTPSPASRRIFRDEAVDLRAEAATIRIFEATKPTPNTSSRSGE